MIASYIIRAFLTSIGSSCSAALWVRGPLSSGSALRRSRRQSSINEQARRLSGHTFASEAMEEARPFDGFAVKLSSDTFQQRFVVDDDALGLASVLFAF